jgi:hypothetical protein
MLRIKPRLAFINGVLLENRVLIFRFQLLAVYVLLVHNCGECRISVLYISEEEDYQIGFVEFDMKLFRRKRLLLRIYSSARNQNQNKPTAPPSDLFFFLNMKHKKLIQIPPYFIDPLPSMCFKTL